MEKMLFACPKCGGELFSDPGHGCARCARGHTYDRAREGYYNLLLGGGGTHGDDRAMVTARRRFLATGLYAPLAERVADLCAELTPAGGALLDVGAGEGYYTDAVARRLAERGGSRAVAAFDISKEAVRLATRRNRDVLWAVAGAYDMPVLPATFATVTNLFSPLVPGQVWRALSPDGIFLLVIPGTEHLYGLKEVLYERPYKKEIRPFPLSGFTLLAAEQLRRRVTLTSPAEIESLFMMTPYAYRTRPADRDRLLSLPSLDTDIDFWILSYRKMDPCAE